MAKILRSKSEKNIKATARLLHKIGAIKFAIPRGPLSPQQKSAITRGANAHGDYVRHPDMYATRTVGARTARNFADMGIQLSRRKGMPPGSRIALIKKRTSATKIEIRHGNLYEFDFTNGVAYRSIRIDGDFMTALSRARPANNETYSAQFGTDRRWNRQFTKEALQRYIVNTMQPRFRSDESFDRYITGLSLVRVIGGGFVLGADSLSKKDAKKWDDLQNEINGSM